VENIQKATLTIFLYLFIKLRFMKRITIAGFLFTSFSFFAQQQIGNGNMESWDNVGQGTEEPTNWNSFKSAQGSFTSFGSQQLQRSTSIRTGATGQYCARIWSKSTLGIVANGNLTVGRINMGSTTASDPANYNISLTADANFSEALTTSPDSLVFWVKFTPASGNPNARVHAILHDAYDFRDPIDANSTPHIISRAELNYPSTNGQWVRKSVPFVNQGPATSQQFILITFTTNQTPGGGAANDEVLVDDIEMIYNPVVTNQQMTANNDAASTNQNTPTVINVLSNDTDPENNINSASVMITQQGQNGVANVNQDGTVTYTPNSGFFGQDYFGYVVCDGGNPETCDSAFVIVTINQVSGLAEESMNSFVSYNDGLMLSNISGSVTIYTIDGLETRTIDANAAKNLKLKSGIYFIHSTQLNHSFKILVP